LTGLYLLIEKMTTLNLRVGDYVVVARWNGENSFDSIEQIKETQMASPQLLLVGYPFWVDAHEVTRNATQHEAIAYHTDRINHLIHILPDDEGASDEICRQICYHRQQILALQAFSGQARSKSKK
jgi:hypothetical protein